MIRYYSTSMAPIQVGSLVFQYQAIDIIGPTDLLNSSSRRLARALKAYMPVDDDIIARAPEFEFHHIGESLDPVHLLTSALTIVPTTTIEDCPELDILIVGGPAPMGFQLSSKYAKLIKRHVAAGKLLFTICTGAAVVAASGVLDGRNATINNIEYNWAKKEFPKVKWTKEKKWVIDGNIWTGSGALAGMDMVSFWLKENFGPEVLRHGALGLDYEMRDVNGIFSVLPKRHDESGKLISSHIFPA